MTEKSQDNVPKGKRKRNGKPAKIALGTPVENFRPLLSEAQTQKISTLMKSLLHQERPKTKLPWKKLSKLPKDERKERIKELNEKNILSEALQKQRKSIKFGLNSVARAILHCQISSCLLAGDVEPEILIDHLVTLATTRGIPLLVVPKLKKITRETVGFPCIVLGIMAREENHYLKPLDEEISCIFSEFKPPSNFACVLKRRVKPPVIRKKLSVSNETRQKLKLAVSEARISKKLPEVSDNNRPQEASLDFIPLNLKSESSETNDPQPRIDVESIYLFPNFKTVPRNPNKMKKKRKN